MENGTLQVTPLHHTTKLIIFLSQHNSKRSYCSLISDYTRSPSAIPEAFKLNFFIQTLNQTLNSLALSTPTSQKALPRVLSKVIAQEKKSTVILQVLKCYPALSDVLQK